MSDIHALVGAYAVDALDDLERRRFEEHLATCADCREEVASFREASTALASTTEVAPPPALRDRLMAEIATVRPLPPLPETIQAAPADDVEEPVHRARRRRFPALLATAATLAVLGGGSVVVWQQRDDGSSEQQLTATQQVLRADDAKAVAVDFPDGAQAKLVRSAALGKAVLVTHDMPAAPTGKVYQLWLQSAKGAMEPAGLMPRGADQEVLLDGDAGTATAAGITVEPAGGSEAPTSDPIALFDFHEGV
ncbi:anti-sigma factor [Nocardioides jensenii]|uniref:anti-sigma factor n=1 Tax=Nocardioides jensenii TaxID=1843 RepID=UPI0008348C10|nr:anti-sigma factor [Nocardioides jensenii]